MGEGRLLPAVVTTQRPIRAVVRFLMGAAAAFALAGTVTADAWFSGELRTEFHFLPDN